MTVYPTKAHWQTMDSAPKTGRILVAIKSAFDGKARVEIRRYDDDHCAKRPRPYWASDGMGRVMFDRQDTPDLWAPLPQV